MKRLDLVEREKEMLAFTPEAEAAILAHLRLHPEDVFTISDLRAALYPEWSKLTDEVRDPKLMALIKAAGELVSQGKVEALRDFGGREYYGLK